MEKAFSIMGLGGFFQELPNFGVASARMQRTTAAGRPIPVFRRFAGK
jgi:hypothetical protein